jgi:hypothetical protein
MSGIDLLPALAERLDGLVPADEAVVADWEDILRRVEPPPSAVPPRKRRRLRLAVVAVALFLVLAGIATGTYFVLRASGGVGSGGLTIFAGDPQPQVPSARDCRRFGCGPTAAIASINSDGTVKRLWRCPHPGFFCGDMTSMAWSPDGRKLAFTMDQIGGMSGYVGLHIIDTRSGRDRQFPRIGGGDTARQMPETSFGRFRARSLRELGCLFPTDVAWSADSKSIAYACNTGSDLRLNTSVFVMAADGSNRRRVPTGSITIAYPSWSPDGTQITFATGLKPSLADVFVLHLDGSGRALVARNATAPVWSPDGTTIAFRARCGVRLVTPSGRDVTPDALVRECVRASPGLPAWSLDGKKLAFAGRNGVLVVNADGRGLTRITNETGRGPFGPLRPAWTPEPRVIPRPAIPPVERRCC